jgi:hypothetical protein
LVLQRESGVHASEELINADIVIAVHRARNYFQPTSQLRRAVRSSSREAALLVSQPARLRKKKCSVSTSGGFR